MYRNSRWLKQAVLAGIVIAAVFRSANAQETKANPKPGPAQAVAVDPAKEAEIRKLLEATGAKKNAIEFGQQLSEYLRGMMERSLPPGGEHNKVIEDTLISRLMDHMGSDEFIVRLIPIYDKAFTEDDLKGINRFYATPAGQKLLAQTPVVMEAANNASQQWIQQLVPEIIGQMANQFPELKDAGGPAAPSGSRPAGSPATNQQPK